VQPLQWVGHLAHADCLLRTERDVQGNAAGLVYSRERVRELRYKRKP
jgi:hypothetical protein